MNFKYIKRYGLLALAIASYIGNKLFESFCSRGFTSGCIEKKCIHVFCVERKRQNNNTSESR